MQPQNENECNDNGASHHVMGVHMCACAWAYMSVCDSRVFTRIRKIYLDSLFNQNELLSIYGDFKYKLWNRMNMKHK